MTGLMRAKRWIGQHLILGLGLLVLAYTFVPIAIVVLMSFNDSSQSRNVYKFQEFTLDNWLNPGSWAPGMTDSVWLSIRIAFLATLVATILGTLAAFALVRHRFAGRSAANLIIFLPMASPEIVMGS
ncbi:MAG: ABC transporter permease, partial [Mycetocola sp.]